MTTVEISRRIIRPALWLGGIAVVGAVAWGVDSGVAMHAERNISHSVKEGSRLEHSPSVYIGGIPYVLAAWSGEIPLIEVNALDVEVPQIGLVNASTTLRDVTVTPEQVWSGNFDGAPVSTFSRAISLDGVALGRLLDMTDLSIANPDNISPSGGKASEAELTGTVPGTSEKSTVDVTLRLIGDMFEMTPTKVSHVPEGVSEDTVRAAFTYRLNTHELPLPAAATYVYLQGGSISFETQKRNTMLHTGQLSPLEIDGQFDAEGNATGNGIKPPPAPATQ